MSGNQKQWDLVQVQFKFKPFFRISQTKSIRACMETSNLTMQSCPSKFIFWERKENRNFSKQVWIPNKFKSSAKIVLLLGFLIQILFWIRTWFQKERSSLYSNLWACKICNFWRTGMVVFPIYNLVHFGEYKNRFISGWVQNSVPVNQTGSPCLKTPTVAPRLVTQNRGQRHTPRRSLVLLDGDFHCRPEGPAQTISLSLRL
jgi:hypothetical protein